MTEVVPAIIPEDFSDIEERTALVAGRAETVQIDICDGRFVSRKTWPYCGDGGEFAALVSEKRGMPFWEKLDYEFDLMVREPEAVIADYVRAGASRILIHIESTARLEEIIHEWKDAVELGLALNPKTPLEELESFAHEVRLIQLMGSDHLGHQGVALDTKTRERVRRLRAKYPEHIIGVDIGVNLTTAPELIAAGANHLAVGSAIFASPDPAAALEAFRRLGDSHESFKRQGETGT